MSTSTMKPPSDGRSPAQSTALRCQQSMDRFRRFSACFAYAIAAVFTICVVAVLCLTASVL